MSLPLRARAAQQLAGVLQQQASLALPHDPALSAQDKALLQELCFGVCRQYHRLEPEVRRLVAKPLKAKDSDILALVYLGLYQLLFTRIPDHAAISATVEAAQALKKPWAKGLLNAVLRRVQRGDLLPEAARQHPAIHYSHPQWLVEHLQQAWPEHWQAILTANNQHPPMTLRVNARQGDRATYQQALCEQNLAAQNTPYSDTGLTLAEPASVSRLPGFDVGRVSVQDEAAQLAAQLLDLAPGQRVLDACCAPGGKTCHILETCAELREVVALDQDEARMVRVRENLARLQLQATLRVADGTQLDDWWDGVPFERILLDAPCSATGVIRRHPDIKLLRRVNDIDKLVALQRQLLRQLWRTLAPGGRLLYATCSVLPQENEQQMQWFTATQDDAQPVVLPGPWGLQRPVGRQLLPQNGGHDGFYYAALVKLSSSNNRL